MEPKKEGGHQINGALSQSKLKVSVIQADKLKKITVEPFFFFFYKDQQIKKCCSLLL